MVVRFRRLVLACDAVAVRSDLSIRRRRRRLGHQCSDCLGFCDCQFCMVGRHRPRRHLDLGDTLAAAPGMANVDQPICRGDDAVRRGLRRTVSVAAHGTALVCLLAVAVSKHDEGLASIPQPLGVGCVCSLDLFHRFAVVLVRRPDSRHGHASRQSSQSFCTNRLWCAGHGLAWFGATLAPA